MSKLLEQIQADAEARLGLPPGRHPNDEKPRFSKYLDLEKHRLKLAHRDGRSGLEICHARARTLDLVFCSLMRACAALERYQGKGAAAPHALVAIGGYGRSELNPHSDVDILFLHDLPEAKEDSPLPFLELMSRTMLMFDLFPKVGYSVRNLDDCVRIANSDMQSQTSLIEARLICGDPELFDRFQRIVRTKCIKGRENAYIEARMEDQANRRGKYGDSASLQEPNIKNGCGGLRDYQNLIWMARFRYGCLSLADLRDQGMVSEQEQRQLDAAYDFLLRVRNELHYHLDRPVEKLSRDVQPAVARNLGYTDRSLAVRVERFMGDYYLHARHIHLITRTVEQRLALLPQPRRLPTLKQFLHRRRKDAMYAVDGFKFVHGEVHPAASDIFETEPARLMRAFRQAQLRGATLGPDIASMIRNSLHLVTPAFRMDSHVHETFLEILRQKGSVARVLREMHEVGLLGAFLPAFGRLTGKVQHEFYHIFTTDEHTLVCLEMLDALHGTEDETLLAYGELLQEVERPDLLYLALLLHDVGKGRRTPDHSETGGRMAASTARKLGLARPDVDTVAFLVRHHLAMIQTGLKRDLDSPDEIERFAGLVENEENLRLLTLLTVADTRGTSATLWNGFKNTMLRKLLARTREQLRGEALSVRADRGRRETLAAEVWELTPDAIQRDEFEAHFSKLASRYFVCRSAREIVADLELMHEFMTAQLLPETQALEPVLAWHDLPDRGFSQVKVCTWDHRGAFSRIAGALTAAGLNILSAEIFTREEGVVIDTFLVLDAGTGLPVKDAVGARCNDLLKEIVAERGDPLDYLRKAKARRRAAKLPEVDRLPTQVWFDNETLPKTTVIEVQAEDRMGLLTAILQVISDEGLDIDVAKVSTEKGMAMDTFYVRAPDGGRITSRARQRELTRRLKAGVDELALS